MTQPREAGPRRQAGKQQIPSIAWCKNKNVQLVVQSCVLLFERVCPCVQQAHVHTQEKRQEEEEEEEKQARGIFSKEKKKFFLSIII